MTKSRDIGLDAVFEAVDQERRSVHRALDVVSTGRQDMQDLHPPHPFVAMAATRARAMISPRTKEMSQGTSLVGKG